MRALWLVLLPVLLFGQAPPSEPRNRPQQADESGGKQNSANSSQQPPPSPGASGPGGIDKPAANPQKNAPDPEPQGIWQKAFAPESFPTWALVVVGLAGSYFALRTLGAIKRQANAMDRQTKLIQVQVNAGEAATAIAKESASALMDGQRGWILVHEINAPHISPPGPYDRGQLDFEVVLKVSGNSPCKIIDAGMRFHLERSKEKTIPLEPDLPESPGYHWNSLGTNTQTRDIPQAGVIFEPGKVFRIYMTLEDGFTLERFEAVNEGREFLCAYGFVLYCDAFSRDHETRFCFVRGADKIPPQITGKTSVGLYLSEFYPSGPPEYNRTT